jgi:uncharacterized repeat protein (TIGR01451 family)
MFFRSPKTRRSIICSSILAMTIASPLFLVTAAQAVPLPKDWCGRLWGVIATGSILWDSPTNGVSSSAPPANISSIPSLPTPTFISDSLGSPGYATLGIHARSGTLYALDRGNGTLYQYNMATGGSWTSTVLSQVPIINSDPASNFNKMTVTGNKLIIANSSSMIGYTYDLVPATGVLVSSSGTPNTYTFDGNTLLPPNNTLGSPPGNTNIGGGDIAQDEYGDTYMVTYDDPNTVPTTTTQYAYFYKLNSSTSQWQFKARIQKADNTDQFAGMAFYNDTIYVKGTAGTLFRLPLTRLVTLNDYDWVSSGGAIIPIGNGTGTSDMASCGIPAINIGKSQNIYTDEAATILTPDQSKIGTGQYIKYTIVVANVGDAWSRGTMLQDNLPTGVTYVANSATVDGVNLNAAIYPFTAIPATSNGAIAPGIVRLAVGGNANTVTYTYTVRVDGTASTVKNEATVTWTNPVPSETPNCTILLNCGTTIATPFAPSIFGTVWSDADGSAAGTFNNIFTAGETGTNTGTANALHALLVRTSNRGNKTVVVSQPVAADGKYVFSVVPIRTGYTILLSTVAGTVGNAPPTAAIPLGWKNTSPLTTTAFDVTTADILNEDFGIRLPAGVILVKRITAVNGKSINPNDGTNLAAVIDSGATTNDDPTRKWPVGYLQGEVNAGKVGPGDTIEYTIYYLNDGGTNAKNIKICDPVRGSQTYVAGSMKLLPGGASTPISLTDITDLTIDRANSYTAGNAPTDCNAVGSTVTGTDRGGVALQLTGTGSSQQPNLLTLSASTAAGSPTTSYGFFRFTTQVLP